MNRYPLWKYAILAFALVIGLLYTTPNLYGEAPAVQVSSGKATLKLDAGIVTRVEQVLGEAKLKSEQVQFDGNSLRARFADTEVQLKAKDALTKALNPDPNNTSYIIALNLQSRTPEWMIKLRALPMYLGLDLRGGVHFLMQVNMKDALAKKIESLTGDVRSFLREKNIRHAGITRDGNNIEVRFRDAAAAKSAQDLLTERVAEMGWTVQADPAAAGENKLIGALKPESAKAIQDQAIKQNITTLHNRVNELGVSEPVIQQQGADRVVVQLPGVQDTARAKDIIGRTATLEMRLVNDTAEGQAALSGGGAVPFGSERYIERNSSPIVVYRQIIITGDCLTDAQPGFDSQTQEPKVDLTVDAKCGRIMRDVSRENIGKRMAILLFEKGRGEVVTAPVIRGELGNRFQISGRMTSVEATDTALLLRAGSLYAPMEIIEERTIGPSLGAENIQKGFDSVLYGFVAIALFMCCYYLLFGVFSTIALGFNLLLLVAVLSMIQATLTLPGMAAIALTLGMAIDANVLINDRVREELRGAPGGHPGRLRAGLGHHPRLQYHHLDRRHRPADLWLRAGARFCRGPLPGHPDVDVLGRGVLARAGQPLVWRQEAPEVRQHRPGVAARWPGAAAQYGR
jgi:preprotein translocase subunit SecD